MRCVGFRLWLVSATLCSLTLPVVPAQAETTAIPPNMFEGSQDKRVVASQLRLAHKLGRKALAGFQVAPRDASVPVDEDVMLAARETYGLIRAARHGLELSLGNQNFPDPIDQLSFKRLDEAWNLARYPVDKISWAGIPREEYLSDSIQKLSRALQLVDQALLLLP